MVKGGNPTCSMVGERRTRGTIPRRHSPLRQRPSPSVNDTCPTQAGWTPVNFSGINGGTFSAVGNVFLDHRDRVTSNTDDVGGDAANNGMWRDFVFADERVPGTDQPN